LIGSLRDRDHEFCQLRQTKRIPRKTYTLRIYPKLWLCIRNRSFHQNSAYQPEALPCGIRLEQRCEGRQNKSIPIGSRQFRSYPVNAPRTYSCSSMSFSSSPILEAIACSSFLYRLYCAWISAGAGTGSDFVDILTGDR
jgi:hypothetical protein